MAIINKLRNYLLWQRHKLRCTKLQEKHPLKYLFFEVTRRCNLACVYCGSSCTKKEYDNELTVDDWIEIARQIARDFKPQDIMVAVTGGEPLIKDGILRVFNELNKLRFRFGIVTNGQILNKTLAKEIVQTGIGSISLSMDAPPAINDKFRGKESSVKVKEAIENLLNANYKGILEVISTLTKPTVPVIDETRKYIAEMKVPRWRIILVDPIGRARENKHLIPDSYDLRNTLEYILKARRDRFLPHPEFCEEGFLGYRYEGFVRPYLYHCRAGITVGGIMHDGKIGACPEISDYFVQGDIRKNRFKTVWEDGYKDMRDRSWTKKGECARCKYYDICKGGAVHLYPDTKSDFMRCFYLMCKETE